MQSLSRLWKRTDMNRYDLGHNPRQNKQQGRTEPGPAIERSKIVSHATLWVGSMGAGAAEWSVLSTSVLTRLTPRKLLGSNR